MSPLLSDILCLRSGPPAQSLFFDALFPSSPSTTSARDHRFSESALLCPNTIITITLFGSAVKDLVAASASRPNSLVSKHHGKPISDDRKDTIGADIIWTYTAPEKTGGGKVDIRLCPWPDGIWTRDHLMTSYVPPPDVILGLNAGLNSYVEWQEVVQISFM